MDIKGSNKCLRVSEDQGSLAFCIEAHATYYTYIFSNVIAHGSLKFHVENFFSFHSLFLFVTFHFNYSLSL